ENTGTVRWTETDISGLYILTVAGRPQEHLFAVNVPAATPAQQASESDPARLGRVELQALYPGAEFQIAADPSEARDTIRASPQTAADHSTTEAGLRLARWLLWAMVVLLFVEVILAWQFGHYSTAAAAPGEPRPGGQALALAAAIGTCLGFAVIAAVLGH